MFNKVTHLSAVSAVALGLMAGAATAREPGTPTLAPVGATVAVPVGANPPPGFLFSSRNAYNTGTLVDNSGADLPVDVDVKASAFQLHYVPGTKLWGGDYRAMVTFPIVDVNVTTPGGSSSSRGLGDITVSPLNLSWMTKPGVFVSAGLSFGIPTGKFDATGMTPNLGSNATATQLSIGYSYLRDGWNLSAEGNYFIHGKNKDTDYTSGDEVIVNWTAMKDLGGQSLGVVGYGRWQVTDDKNDGLAYGGTTFGKSRKIGIGIGYSRRIGAGDLNVNLMKDIVARNVVSDSTIQINYSIPLGGKNGG